MKLRKKLTKKEWEEAKALGPGIHNFRRKVTLIYNGKKSWNKSTLDKNTGKILLNNVDRDSIEVIIILPGVKIIRGSRFHGFNAKIVIMADAVKRMEKYAFYYCENLRFIRLSRNLEYIGDKAFSGCDSLRSIFIPLTCREIGEKAFWYCNKLIIFIVLRNTQLGENAINCTALGRARRRYEDLHKINVREDDDEWINNEFDLHRECASCNPSEEVIYEIFKEQGRKYFQLKNNIGITASEYLNENPYTDLNDQKLINRHVLDMMGEIIT
ncbi:hypothetical protein CTEN210_13510 [Chaetoceros tenuissimus]|uniref:Leucine-rich repeat domain-containing protein n=1 Tax=Chaetoceros tenuissimus TaxID=426638 RepID=A0AAD3HBG9_9STRA|nr:hypothetical protein CTEN210_13510 [Chaetoceros tenuissimus]